MSTPKHTPGPWKLGPNGGTVVVIGADLTVEQIENLKRDNLDFYGGLLIAESILTKKDAQLISAAPEMLEVLQTIENDKNQVPPWLWRRIQQAIKTATE